MTYVFPSDEGALNPGLTDRVYFAAHAPEVPKWFQHDREEGQTDPAYELAKLCAWRYAYADAMVEAGA